MKYWGTLLVAGALLLITSSALAEPDTQKTGMAMPMPVTEDGNMLAGSPHGAPSAYGIQNSQNETEKARLSVDMDQTSEKLEAKIYELKTESLSTKGLKNNFKLNRKINKLEGQKSAVVKMHHKVAKVNNGNLNNAKRDWTNLKTKIDKQLSVLE